MDWKDEEVEQAWTGARGMDVGSREATRAIMSTAVELVAARGGTMTADGEHVFDATTEDGGRVWVESTGEWGHEGGNISWAIDALAAHVVALRAAHGARVAVLEAELAKSNKAEFARAEECMSLRERLTAAEEGNRELVRRAQQAEALLERERKQHTETREMHSQMCRVSVEHQKRADVAEQRAEYWQRKCATLSAAGQVLSAHVDKACAPCADSECGRHPTSEWGDRSVRYEDNASIAYDTGFNEGAEAMRAACLEAVQTQLITEGIHEKSITWSNIKSAIEGAAP